MSDPPRQPGPTKVAHIGIAVTSLEEALPFYQDHLGLELLEILEEPERGLRIALLPCGESLIELMEATSPDSQISRFLETRGPGIHHLCLGVDDIQAKLDALADAGVRLVSGQPEIGAEGHPVSFVHPKATGGVLLELLEEE